MPIDIPRKLGVIWTNYNSVIHNQKNVSLTLKNYTLTKRPIPDFLTKIRLR